MLRAVGWLGWLIVGYLLGAAVYELTLALRHSISPDGEWRILVGDDAHILDEAVRADPTNAYEPAFLERLRAQGVFTNMPQSQGASER